MSQATVLDRSGSDDRADHARRIARLTLREDVRVADYLGLCQAWVNWVFQGGTTPEQDLPRIANVHNAVRHAITGALNDVYGISRSNLIDPNVYVRRNQLTHLAG